MMPKQLAEGLKRRVKGAPPRPIVENATHINVNTFKISSLSRQKTYNMPNISLRYSWLSALRLSCEAVEFVIRSPHRGTKGRVQQFKLKPQKVPFGVRYFFICDCGEHVQKLYFVNQYLACQYCHRLLYASQTIDRRNRPVLQAARIQAFLDNKPRLFHKTQERLRKKLGDKAMLPQTKFGTRAASLIE
jgi:hypothetical protein